MSTGVLVGIVAGVVAILSIAVVVVVLGAQLVGGAVSAITTGPPLVEGEDALPIARAPLACVEQCFTEDSVGAALSADADFRDIGLGTETDSWGDYDPSDAAAEYRRVSAEWRNSELSPDACFFSFFGSPVATELGVKPVVGPLDRVEFGGTYMSDSELSSLWQAVRIFDTSASAEQHMALLDEETRGCNHMDAEEYAPTALTPAPALELPDSVSAIGWREVSTGWRYYVFDVQRGNLVVRSILSAPVDEVSEQEFRQFVEVLAASIAEIEPVAAQGSQ